MKKLTFVIAVMVSVLFVSCEDLQEITEVGIETLIEADMPVASIKATSIGTESDKVEEDIYGFVGGGMFSLSDNEDIEGYIDNIRDIIALEGSLIQFNGAVEGNKILTIHLKYGIMTDSSTEPSMRSVFSFSGQLSAKNGSIKYLNDSWSPILMSALEENKDKVFAIKIEGTANYNVNVPVQIKVPVKVNASPL